ncbi:tautomerase family protein [Mucilaginibacter antarcticus]|uniref:Tautomerase family protein n=1 Tax=Mucilaginibacter antarcticus TaxID=1855725 RepID=A0ABW5XQL5_9SPHI
MPFVRISLLKTVSKNDRKKISAAIHHALMAEFDIPQFDYFHVIDALEPDDLFFPKSYLGIDHVADMAYIQIIAGSGRNYDQKKQLFAAIANRISEVTKIRKEDVIIILVENGGKENWSFGNGEIQDLPHIK